MVRMARPGTRVRPLDALCIGGFVLSIVYPMVLTPLEPSLLAAHPILVEAVIGTTESLVTAGAFARVGRAALWLAIIAPLIFGDVLDPFSWWTGRRYGARLLEWGKSTERYRQAVERAERFFRRWGWWAMVLAYYIPIPNLLIYLAAGESGMSLWLFISLDLIGTALGIVPFILLGYAIGQSAVDVAELITRYSGISTVVLIALIVAWNVFRARRASRQP
jgi:membrane-associated protein